MEHFRLRKYRGPEVWAKVREAYVAGEPGPQLAKRFDVGLANLRKRAMREGWTRTAAARASDPLILATQPAVLGAPPPDPDMDTAPDPSPDEARDAAIRRATALLAQGRPVEAQALLKAAEDLGRVIERTPHLIAQPPAVDDALRAKLIEVAMRNADAMMHEAFEGRTAAFSLPGYHWRLRRFGPDVAHKDFLNFKTANYGRHDHWDEDGRLNPLSSVDPEGRLQRCLDEGEQALKTIWSAPPDVLAEARRIKAEGDDEDEMV